MTSSMSTCPSLWGTIISLHNQYYPFSLWLTIHVLCCYRWKVNEFINWFQSLEQKGHPRCILMLLICYAIIFEVNCVSRWSRSWIRPPSMSFNWELPSFSTFSHLIHKVQIIHRTWSSHNNTIPGFVEQPVIDSASNRGSINKHAGYYRLVLNTLITNTINLIYSTPKSSCRNS